MRREAKLTVCASCKTHGYYQNRGAHNWVMCDTCNVTYCRECYLRVMQQSSWCMAHDPRGRWLTGHANGGTIVFG